MVELIFENFR